MENLRRQLKPETNAKPRLKNTSDLLETLEVYIFVIALFVLVNILTARFVVDGTSMAPTFKGGEYLIIDRFSYNLAPPERGDIIVFHAPNEPNRDFIKRVLGLPSESVEFRNQQLYINGQLIDEPYLGEACNPNRCENSFTQLGEDEYFVMGDNRNNSTDSRSFGAINLDIIVGEAVVLYWPYDQVNWIAQLGFPDE